MGKELSVCDFFIVAWTKKSWVSLRLTFLMTKIFTKEELDCIQILNEDCFNLNSELSHKPYDIYLYDGHHHAISHEMAITKFWDHLADECIIMVDDWDWVDVKKGTLRGFEKVNANIIYQKDVSKPSQANGFWNGCGIFLIKK